MTLLEVLGISFAVSIDALAVSIGGALCSDSSRTFRNAGNAALFFGVFQFLMPVCGYFCSAWIVKYVGSAASFIGFGLLAFVGTKMITDALKLDKEEHNVCKLGVTDFFAPKNLVLPAIATSIDALAVGAGFAFAGTPLWFPAVSMGVVTGTVSGIAVLLGSRIKKLAGEKQMLICGGCVLWAIGIKLLF